MDKHNRTNSDHIHLAIRAPACRSAVVQFYEQSRKTSGNSEEVREDKWNP